jgi:hypothetical protein
MRTRQERQYNVSCRFYGATVECLKCHDFLTQNPTRAKQACVACARRILYHVEVWHHLEKGNQVLPGGGKITIMVPQKS